MSKNKISAHLKPFQTDLFFEASHPSKNKFFSPEFTQVLISLDVGPNLKKYVKQSHETVKADRFYGM